jgi:Cdc6-like AAA superfamily ATPase
MSDHGNKNILIAGQPGVGKTTLVRRIVDRLKDLRCAGFYTAGHRIRDVYGIISFILPLRITTCIDSLMYEPILELS